MLKAVLYTHNDLDGAGCTVMFELAFRHLEEAVEWRTLICSAESIDEKVLRSWSAHHFEKDTLICFADIVPSRPVLENLIANGYRNIKIWDHHITAKWINELLPSEEIVIEKGGQLQCGTSLMYKFFSDLAERELENPIGFNFSLDHNSLENLILLSEFVDLVRSYDTFEWKVSNNTDAKKLNILFQMLGTKIFSRKYVKRLIGLDESKSIFSPTENEFITARIINENDAINNYDISRLYYMDIKGLKTAIKFTGGDGIPMSDFAYNLLEKNKNLDMFIGINLGAGTISFRTAREDLNVATFMAEPLNGGGHAKAAGTVIPLDLRNLIKNQVIKYIDRYGKELKYEKVIKK